MGRLPGPMLAVLDWNQEVTAPSSPQNNNHQSTTEITYCGSYNNSWLHPGSYLIEVIIVHCNDFGVTALKGDNVTESLNFDFAHECMEDPMNHRLTSESAFVSINSEISGTGLSSMGHWVSDTARPLYTRYQPQGCRSEDARLASIGHLPTGLPQRCTSIMNNDNLEALSFVWKQEADMTPYQRDLGFDTRDSSRNLTHGDILDLVYKAEGMAHGGVGNWANVAKRRKDLDGPPKVCVVGMSHSYHLIHAFWATHLGHRFIWAPADRPPKRLHADFFQHYYHEHNCTKFVVGVGLWELSNGAWDLFGGTMVFSRWWDYMSNIVQSKEVLDMGNGNVELYMRSIHPTSIGDARSACEDRRPGDYMSTTVIDGYNYILERVVANSNNSRVKYLDTSFITYPIWDLSYDWW